MLAALACALLTQDPDLAASRASQDRRIAMIARCSPAVCSVMDLAAPGGGSGVVFDSTGLVLTNYHVVGAPDQGDDGKPAGDASTAVPEPSAAELERWAAAHPDASADDRSHFVAAWQTAWREEHLPQGKYQWRNKKIGLPDGELYEAVVLGVDPGSDLAVLRMLPKTPAQQWPSCSFGDSDQLLVGETVLAMGNPFLLATDFTPTVTFGVVSGTHRYQAGGGNGTMVYPDCIQVDAPVNPGNSGGPLFNEAGEIVGINGRISIGDRGRVNVGVGFAIASNQIRNFLADLVAGRHAEHGTLDLSCWYMTAPHEQSGRRGVFVQQLYQDSVAAAAGVSLGDEILSFHGTAVRSANQMATMVGVLPAGAWVELGFRPALGESYGAARLVEVRLARLDTGSSADLKADSERLASRENRRIATRALLGHWTRIADSADAANFALQRPDGGRERFRRRGAFLRIDLDATALIRTGSATGFAIVDGAVQDLTVEQAALLDRHFRGNPLLWPAAQRTQQLQDSLLGGGSHVLGVPAWRFALPGEGEVETMVFDDGEAAGCVLRDPVRKQRIELHVRGDQVRFVADGAIEPGWRIERRADEPVGDDVFARPR